MREEDDRKNIVVAMLAHELRNPLAPIGTGAELLKVVRSDEEQVRRTGEIISRQIRPMTNLIEDLVYVLYVSRVTRGPVELDWRAIDMHRVVATAIEKADPLIEHKYHQLALLLPPGNLIVLGDDKRLVQVVGNLLNNAAKYMPTGARLCCAWTQKARAW